MGRSIQQAYGQPPQVVLTTPLLTGIDGVQKMSKSFGNHIGVTEPPGEMYGKTLRIPDEQIAPWFSLLLGAEPPAGARPARRQARARARARDALPRRGGRGRGGGRVRPRVHRARAARRDRGGRGARPQNGTVHLPAVIAEVFGRSRSEARRMLAQGGVQASTASRWRPTSSTCPAAALDGRVLQLGKRHFRRLRVT